MPRNSKNLRKTIEYVDNQEYLGVLKLDEPLSDAKKKQLRERCYKYGLILSLVKRNDLEGVKVLIEKVNISPNFKEKQLTALMVAAQRGNLEIFKYLLKAGADARTVTIDNYSAFTLAVYRNRYNIVKYMVEEKLAGRLEFDPNLAESEGLQTPLMVAVINGYKDTIDQLLRLKEININQIDKEHHDHALLYCAWNSDKDKKVFAQIASSLIKNESDIFIKSKDGETALMGFAHHHNFLGVILILQRLKELHKENVLEALKKHVNEKTNDLWTALHYAAENGNIEIAQKLLEAGADIDARNKKGETPIMLAYKHFQMVQFLAKGHTFKDATQKQITVFSNIHLRDNTGSSVLINMLHEANGLARKKEFKPLARMIKTIKFLVEKSDDLNIASSQVKTISDKRILGKNISMTALAFASSIGNKGLIEQILKKGGSMEALVGKGASIFQLAYVYYRHSRVFSFSTLLKHKIKKAVSISGKAQQLETQDQYDEVIGLLTDLICGNLDSKPLLRILPNNVIVIQLQDKTIITLKDEEFPAIIEKILEKMSQEKEREITADELIHILKTTASNVKFYKEPETVKLIPVRMEIPSTQNGTETDHSLSETEAPKAEKVKTKGISAEEVIRNKMLEFARRRALNPDIDMAASILSPVSEKAKAKSKTIEPEFQSLVEKYQALEAGLKSEDELKVLHSNKASRKQKSKVHQRNEEVDLKFSEEEKEVSELANSFLTSLEEQNVHKVSAKTNGATLASQTQIGPLLSLRDQLAELQRVLRFDLNNYKTLSFEAAVFLEHTALWGSFARLMEELKKLPNHKWFHASLARAIRNLTFHQEGGFELFSFTDNGVDSKANASKGNVSKVDISKGNTPGKSNLDEIRILCKNLSQYLESTQESATVKKSKQKQLASLELLMQQFDSQLFNDLMFLALKYACEQLESGVIPPDVETCLNQIKRGEWELAQYQKICHEHENLMDDPIIKNMVQNGLGFTVARIGSYVSIMKQNYYAEYRASGLQKYKHFIKAGILYRHGDESFHRHEIGHNEQDKSDWRVFIDQLTEELIITYLVEFQIKEGPEDNKNKSRTYLPAFGTQLSVRAEGQEESELVSQRKAKQIHI